ncbi:MAG: BACON domain-containing protein, partial [Candidatus Aminicenantes bacterium]
PEDNNGNGDGITPFTRVYNKGTTVTLTAPDAHSWRRFSKWTVDGVDNTGSSVQAAMDSNCEVTASYEILIPPVISIDRNRLNFGYIIDGSVTGPQTLTVTCSGESLDWTAAADDWWLKVNPPSGGGFGEVAVSINTSASGLSAGNYTGTVTVCAPEAINSPKTITVTLKVYEPGTSNDPFGEFVLPIDGSTVSSGIPVTGWVLDDIGIESVKLYREEGISLIYIGDASFIPGARPDVEEAYPDYPMNHQAGWGYMMMTNFFPNEGNGTFDIHAIAATTEGEEVTLGIKTITCDNANAIKPFGAIDTPAQGGTASGSSFTNWGWVLTPRPNRIPTDGSTIDVFVDGKNLGHPIYNIYRSDIAASFPDYFNSNGAGGYFNLDTTAYTNGVHTIYWVASDSAGNSDGIGSRYFMVQNAGGSQQGETVNGQCSLVIGEKEFYSVSHMIDIPVDNFRPVRVKKGYKQDCKPQYIYPGDNGIVTIDINQLERIEIHLSDYRDGMEFYTGYLLVGSQLRQLPVGSTMDIERGIFYWQPGPGFYGKYRFVFIKKMRDGEVKLLSTINIH